MDTIKVKEAKTQEEIVKAQEIRRRVFQLEQGIDAKIDFDGKDEESNHFIAYCRNEAVGTIRVRYLTGKTAKLERLAVLKAHRKIGIGRKIVDSIIDFLKDQGMENIMLDSQEHARKFYEGIGFAQKGEVFWEVGIPHIEMWKKI
jgi:predicted GNAT family N-acyltransferase